LEYGISAMLPPNFTEEERELLFTQLMEIADAQRMEATMSPEEIDAILDEEYTEEELLEHAYYWAALKDANPDILH
jgi:hypothetical protein